MEKWNQRNRPMRLERRFEFESYEGTRSFLDRLAEHSESVKRFPDVNIINKWPLEAFKDLKTDSSTALIALTHDPKIDDPALKHALKNKFFYIGALGSKTTHLNRCQRLREAGFKEEEINSIHGPIGIKLGGKSAPEIALSIIAQLVSETYKS